MSIEERNNLVIQNKNLVYSTIHQLRLKISDDIIQEGFIALIKAADNYTEEKGKFSTYACNYIAGCVKTFINQKDRIIRPRKYNSKFEQHPVVFTDDITVECAYTLDESEDIMYIEQFMNTLSELERKVLTYRLEGDNKQAIRKTLKISNSLINKLLISIQNKWVLYNCR